MDKKCSSCLIYKEFSQFYVIKNRVTSKCKECTKHERKIYRENNKDKISICNKKYNDINSLKIKENRHNRYERDKLSGKAQFFNKNYNKEKRNIRNSNRRKNDPLFKFSNNIRRRVNIFLKSKNISKNNPITSIIGCSFDELKIYIENLFTEGMTWEKIGKEIHIDHKIPLSFGKTEEDIIKLFHYTNLQPLWKIDNLKKGSKLLLIGTTSSIEVDGDLTKNR